MAKTLSFTDTSPQTVKIGDTTTSFTLICGNDNVATDLTKVTSITVKLGNASGYLKSATVDPTSLTDPTTGQVTVKFNADLMTSLPAGSYAIEVWVDDSAGTSIYPSDGSTGFTIANNIQSANGSTITTITFDDFVKAMNKAASTIAKGDKGEKGDTPDLSNYTTVTDLNNGLSTKVTDNKNGTEQLNGVQVQPYNKLSDTIGGRNLLINTAQLNDSTVCLDNKSNTSDTYLGLNIYQINNLWDGVGVYWHYLAPKLKTNTNYIMSEYVINTSPTTSVNIGVFGSDTGVVFNSPINYIFLTLPPNSGWTRISALVNIASVPTTVSGTLKFENANKPTDGYVQFAGLKFEQGSIATDWTPAPEDKVNVSDMRKPASDVAGIEEVNAKQDKIGYTPADDSKVLHLSTGDTTARPTSISAGYQYFDTSLNKPIWYTGKNWVDATGTTV
ncbi:collagen-like protein [Lactiplantibacillus plantarum]|uniref:collagen-like protein n=1 Tax=Lactiplantibacillus plantarum TaxID=1590 RepID=UPI00273964EB|nr:collagen-like protein [Lactiplantibacillus plantarum]MDP4436613.1 collagen-like protein [Lactiplantibacillus plantarum]MDP4439739.1 collagen-like protein [Lactiplantibacillus plantarum]MDP4458318.1 collagen-like protein [Lactiplantibacillus plantarum]